jgi:hypothetical protein
MILETKLSKKIRKDLKLNRSLIFKERKKSNNNIKRNCLRVKRKKINIEGWKKLMIRNFNLTKVYLRNIII